MDRPKKLIYFEVVQDAEDGYAYGGFEHLHEAVSHLLKEDSAHIEMSTNINEVVDLNNPCNTCKYGNNKTVLRCRECESPWWKNHEPRDLYGHGQWIPVSERLPEIHKDVLVSLRSLDVEVGFRAETEPYFYCKGDYIELQNVLAWMPLPEPYKEESEENKNER